MVTVIHQLTQQKEGIDFYTRMNTCSAKWVWLKQKPTPTQQTDRSTDRQTLNCSGHGAIATTSKNAMIHTSPQNMKLKESECILSFMHYVVLQAHKHHLYSAISVLRPQAHSQLFQCCMLTLKSWEWAWGRGQYMYSKYLNLRAFSEQ